jgi:hypothetical protein
LWPAAAHPQHHSIHPPFETGYDFWIPSFMKHLAASFRYIPGNIARLWNEFALRPVSHYFVAQYYGTGTYFVAAFILLASTAFFFIRISRFLVCAFLASFIFVATALCYLFSTTDARFYLPLLVLPIAVAVLPVTREAKFFWRTNSWSPAWSSLLYSSWPVWVTLHAHAT